MIRRALLLAAALLSGVGGAYTVKPGDTLYSLARANGTTVSELMRLNRLTGTALEVGQTLRLPGENASSTPTPGSSPLPGTSLQLAGLTVTAPATLRMGDAFVLRLGGPRAAEASVRFPSEVGEDVRRPGEALTPMAAGGERLVLGRVVLGKTTPVVYEVQVGSDVLRGSIPVTGLTQTIQRLNLPPASRASSRTRPARRRTPPSNRRTSGGRPRPGRGPSSPPRGSARRAAPSGSRGPTWRVGPSCTTTARITRPRPGPRCWRLTTARS